LHGLWGEAHLIFFVMLGHAGWCSSEFVMGLYYKNQLSTCWSRYACVSVSRIFIIGVWCWRVNFNLKNMVI
jgi:hypothetical protein